MKHQETAGKNLGETPVVIRTSNARCQAVPYGGALRP